MLTSDQAITMFLADCMLAGAGLWGATGLWRHALPGMALTLVGAIALPLVFALKFLGDALERGDHSCEMFDFFCYSPYGEHWFGWAIGAVLSVPLWLGLAIAASRLAWKARSAHRTPTHPRHAP